MLADARTDNLRQVVITCCATTNFSEQLQGASYKGSAVCSNANHNIIHHDCVPHDIILLYFYAGYKNWLDPSKYQSRQSGEKCGNFFLIDSQDFFPLE
jgi:hypothetical protein